MLCAVGRALSPPGVPDGRAGTIPCRALSPPGFHWTGRHHTLPGTVTTWCPRWTGRHHTLPGTVTTWFPLDGQAPYLAGHCHHLVSTGRAGTIPCRALSPPGFHWTGRHHTLPGTVTTWFPLDGQAPYLAGHCHHLVSTGRTPYRAGHCHRLVFRGPGRHHTAVCQSACPCWVRCVVSGLLLVLSLCRRSARCPQPLLPTSEQLMVRSVLLLDWWPPPAIEFYPPDRLPLAGNTLGRWATWTSSALAVGSIKQVLSPVVQCEHPPPPPLTWFSPPAEKVSPPSGAV